MTHLEKEAPKQRIVYLDYLRALAISSIILFHLSNRVNWMVFSQYSIIPSPDWFLIAFLATCCKFGVDLFFMLSGALSLGRNWDIKTFLSKRIPRITWPFIFWATLLIFSMIALVEIFPALTGIFVSYKIPFTMYPTNYLSLNFLRDCYFGNSYWFSQYWFFWTIFGTYLIMPIINKWICNSSMKEVEYFLVIWAVTCIFTYTLYTDFPIDLTYFTGPIGVVILGYYLRYSERKIFNSLKYALIIMISGMLMLLFVSYLLSSPLEIYKFQRYSILIIIEVTGIFLVFKNIDKKELPVFHREDGFLRKSSTLIAKYSYGIYLCHEVILNVFVILLSRTLPLTAAVILIFLCTLCTCCAIMATLNKVPYLNRIIGAK